jgi:phosphinothricin acetyltransferase
MIRLVKPGDTADIVNIYNYYIFKKIAHFNEIGFKLGKWLDVGYWELILPQGGRA